MTKKQLVEKIEQLRESKKISVTELLITTDSCLFAYGLGYFPREFLEFYYENLKGKER